MLLEILENVPDSRRNQGKMYKLPHILLFSIMAVLSGASSYRKIQRFMYAHRERFNTLFDLNWKSAPAHNTIRYALIGLEISDLEAAFREHSKKLCSKTNVDEQGALIYLAADGKVLRGSLNHFEDQRAAQILSVFSQEEHLIL